MHANVADYRITIPQGLHSCPVEERGSNLTMSDYATQIVEGCFTCQGGNKNIQPVAPAAILQLGDLAGLASRRDQFIGSRLGRESHALDQAASSKMLAAQRLCSGSTLPAAGR